MTDRSIRVILKAEVTDFKRAMSEAASTTDKTSAAFDKNGQKIQTVAGRMTRSVEINRDAWALAGQSLLAFGAIGVAVLGFSAKAAIDWETAWTGVLKTVSGSPAEIAKLEDALRALALVKPASLSEIAAVAEGAGQLGVATKDIAKFTAIMVDLGATTNLSADEAATAIAQLMNVMKTAPEDVDRVGSALVALGNNGASTERDIITMAQRISGAGAIIGLTEAQVLGLSNALASVGIDAEAGGSAISNIMIDISRAVSTGSDDMTKWAAVAGMSADAFSKAWKDDPANALASIVEGLGRMNAAGGDVFTTLTQLGQSDVRVTRALLTMANSGDLLRKSLDLGTQAWKDNNALQTDAEKRYSTTESAIKMAGNALSEAAITIGSEVLPALATLARALGSTATDFADLPEPLKKVILSFGGIVAGLTLVSSALAFVGPKVKEMYVAFQSLAVAAGISANAVRIATISLGAIGAVLAVASIAYSVFTSHTKDAAKVNQALVGTFDELTGAITDTTRAMVYDELVKSGAVDAAKKVGIGLDELTSAALGNADAITAVNGKLNVYATTLNAGAKTQSEMAAAGWEIGSVVPVITDAIGKQSSEVSKATGAWNDQQQALSVSKTKTEEQTKAIQVATEALDKWRQMVATADASFINLGDVMDSAIQKNTDYAQSTADATTTSDDSWQTYYDGVTVSAAEYIAQLQAQVDAQNNWETNMLAITDRVNTGMTGDMRAAANAMIDELLQLGPKGAAQVELLRNMTNDEFAKVVELWSQKGTEAVTEFNSQVEAHKQPTITPSIDMFAANQQLNSWWSNLSSPQLTVSATGQVGHYGHFAGGGPVLGRGTSTSDSIPAWLSNDEHIWTAREVKGAGGHEAVASMRAWAAKGYADGGPVGSATYLSPQFTAQAPNVTVDLAGALAGMTVVVDIGGQPFDGIIRAVVDDANGEASANRAASMRGR